MRKMIAIAVSTGLMAAQASAETVQAAAPEGGVVYRLPAQEVEARLEIKANEQLKSERTEISKGRRLNRAGKIATGILGFIGSSVAEGRYEERCGNFGQGCPGTSGGESPFSISFVP